MFGHLKCTAKCDLCQNFLKESNCFTSTSTSRTYPITQILSSKSKNVIYLVTCKKCNVGSTSNEFKIRFRNHKSSMITKKRTCGVAIHFSKDPHALKDFEFLIIEQLCNLSLNNNSLDDRLLTREAFWCAQLCTLKPHGLVFCVFNLFKENDKTFEFIPFYFPDEFKRLFRMTSERAVMLTFHVAHRYFRSTH